MVLPFPSILSTPSSATARVQKATSSQLLSSDVIMNTEICNSINSDPWLAKDFVKAVKKRLQSKNPKVQLLALGLLETMMKNCDDFVYFQVVERGILQEMVKMVGKAKSMKLREKVLTLLDSWQERFGGPQGKYPQFYNIYSELKRSGVQFPKKEGDSAIVIAPSPKTPLPRVEYGVPISTMERLREKMASETDHFSSSGLGGIRSALELFSRMLQASSPRGFKAKNGEAISGLADQCLANQKRLMHLINSTKNQGLLLEALALNDKMEIALAKYVALAASSGLPPEDGDGQGEEEEDGFSILAKRNTGMPSTNASERFPSVASHALIPLGPPSAAAAFEVEEDMIQFQDNQQVQTTSGSRLRTNPTRNPFSDPESWEPYLMPREGYVAPWARPAMAKSPWIWTDADSGSNPFLSKTGHQFSPSRSTMTRPSAAQESWLS